MLLWQLYSLKSSQAIGNQKMELVFSMLRLALDHPYGVDVMVS